MAFIRAAIQNFTVQKLWGTMGSPRSTRSKDAAETTNRSSLSAEDESFTIKKDEQTGASKLPFTSVETQLTGVPGTSPVDESSPTATSTSGSAISSSTRYFIGSLAATAIPYDVLDPNSPVPRALQRASALAEEEQDNEPETGYISLDALPARPSTPPAVSDKSKAEIDDISQRFATALRFPLPASIRPTATREPRIRIHFIRHAQVRIAR